MNSASLLSKVNWLQQFYASAAVTPQTPATEIQRKAAESQLPDPDLAARVARFLPPKPSTGSSFSAQDVSEAFLQLLLADGSEESVSQWRKRWKKLVKEQGNALGAGAVAIHACVTATGMGLAPSLQDTMVELGDLWEEAV